METIKLYLYVTRYRYPIISILIDTTARSFRFLILFLALSEIIKIIMNLDPQGVLGTYGLISLMKIAYNYFSNLMQYYRFKEIAREIPEVGENLEKVPEIDPEDWYRWASMNTYDLWIKRQDFFWHVEHPYLDFFADTLTTIAVFILIILAIF